MGRIIRLVLLMVVMGNVSGYASSYTRDLPSPEETLERARLGRADYIDVLGIVTSYAAVMESKDVLYPYINIIDDLQAIGSAYDLDSLGSGPLPVLATALTVAAVKFVRVDHDSPEQIKVILRWSDDTARYDMASYQSGFIASTTNKESLFRWHIGLSKALAVLAELRAGASAVQAHQDAQAAVVDAFLRQDDISEGELAKLIALTRSASGFDVLIQSIGSQGLASTNVDYLKVNLTRLQSLHKSIADLGDLMPTRLKRDVSYYIYMITSKLLSLRAAPDASQSLLIIEALDVSQLLDFASAILLNSRRGIEQEQVEFMWMSTRRLVERLLELSLTSQVQDLEALLQKLVLMRSLTIERIEGVYDVTVGHDLAVQTGKMTVIRIGHNNFVLGLNLNGRNVPVFYSLFNVAYNYRDGSFEAHRFSVDDPRYIMPDMPGWFMDWTFEEIAGRISISGRFSDTKKIRPIRATLRDQVVFEDGDAVALPVSMTGIYMGVTARGESIRLSCSQVGQSLAGTIEMARGLVRVPLVYGFIDRPKGRFSLTSAEQTNGRHVQIRGRAVAPDRIKVDYIISGEGVVHKDLELVRLQPSTR